MADELRRAFEKKDARIATLETEVAALKVRLEAKELELKRPWTGLPEVLMNSMDDCRVALLLARAAAHRSKAERLGAKAMAVLAVRAAGQSQWGSELPKELLAKVLELLQWEPAVCGAVRAVCSTWCSIHDTLRTRRLNPRRSLAVMKGKLGWYQNVTEVDLEMELELCEDSVCGPLAELASMPSLRSLSLPFWCAQRAVDAEAVGGLTTLTSLRIRAWGRNIWWRRRACGCWT